MKALVTGGSGFLGHHIVKELVKHRIETVIYDLNEPSGVPAEGNIRSLCKYVKGDVLDYEKITEAMKGCDYVFHTAAIADVDQARKIPRKTMEVNVIGTTNCLEAAKELNVQAFSLRKHGLCLWQSGDHFTGSQNRHVNHCARRTMKSLGWNTPFSVTEACMAGNRTIGTSFMACANPC